MWGCTRTGFGIRPPRSALPCSCSAGLFDLSFRNSLPSATQPPIFASSRWAHLARSCSRPGRSTPHGHCFRGHRRIARLHRRNADPLPATPPSAQPRVGLACSLRPSAARPTLRRLRGVIRETVYTLYMANEFVLKGMINKRVLLASLTASRACSRYSSWHPAV